MYFNHQGRKGKEYLLQTIFALTIVCTESFAAISVVFLLKVKPIIMIYLHGLFSVYLSY